MLIFSFRGQVCSVYFSRTTAGVCSSTQLWTTFFSSLATHSRIGMHKRQICQCFAAITNMYSALQNSRFLVFGPCVMCCWLPSAEMIQHRAAVSELIIIHSAQTQSNVVLYLLVSKVRESDVRCVSAGYGVPRSCRRTPAAYSIH